MNKRHLFVYYLPQQMPAKFLGDCTVVVCDVLRATTTICQALASGARDVVPFREVDEALAAAAHYQRDEIILGGERGGKRIPGFDLGNSPAEYTPKVVRGRRVLFTTTNGTRALDRASVMSRVIVGALVNLSAVAASIEREESLVVLCAGTDGEETGEDILAAGALAARYRKLPTRRWESNGMAKLAERKWEDAVARATAAGRAIADQLAIEFRDTPGGRNLLEIGMERDLVDCAQLDQLDVVPEWDKRTGRISLPSDRKPSR